MRFASESMHKTRAARPTANPISPLTGRTGQRRHGRSQIGPLASLRLMRTAPSLKELGNGDARNAVGVAHELGARVVAAPSQQQINLPVLTLPEFERQPSS